MESALFIKIHLTLKIVISKSQATTLRCHHRGNEEKTEKKNQNQNCKLLVTPFGKGMGDGTFLTFVSSKGTTSFGIGLRKDWALAIF